MSVPGACLSLHCNFLVSDLDCHPLVHHWKEKTCECCHLSFNHRRHEAAVKLLQQWSTGHVTELPHYKQFMKNKCSTYSMLPAGNVGPNTLSHWYRGTPWQKWGTFSAGFGWSVFREVVHTLQIRLNVNRCRCTKITSRAYLKFTTLSVIAASHMALTWHKILQVHIEWLIP